MTSFLTKEESSTYTHNPLTNRTNPQARHPELPYVKDPLLASNTNQPWYNATRPATISPRHGTPQQGQPQKRPLPSKSPAQYSVIKDCSTITLPLSPTMGYWRGCGLFCNATRRTDDWFDFLDDWFSFLDDCLALLQLDAFQGRVERLVLMVESSQLTCSPLTY